MKCKVFFKGHLRDGYIIEERLDKIKVEFKDKSYAPTWFERHEVKRQWS